MKVCTYDVFDGRHGHICICIYICIIYIVLGMQICALVKQKGACGGMAMRGCQVKSRIPNLQQQRHERSQKSIQTYNYVQCHYRL
jgi:hypothetical protein